MRIRVFVKVITRSAVLRFARSVARVDIAAFTAVAAVRIAARIAMRSARMASVIGDVFIRRAGNRFAVRACRSRVRAVFVPCASAVVVAGHAFAAAVRQFAVRTVTRRIRIVRRTNVAIIVRFRFQIALVRGRTAVGRTAAVRLVVVVVTAQRRRRFVRALRSVAGLAAFTQNFANARRRAGTDFGAVLVFVALAVVGAMLHFVAVVADAFLRRVAADVCVCGTNVRIFVAQFEAAGDDKRVRIIQSIGGGVCMPATAWLAAIHAAIAVR